MRRSRKKVKLSSVKNPDSTTLMVVGGIGFVLALGLSVYFMRKYMGNASTTNMISGSANQQLPGPSNITFSPPSSSQPQPVQAIPEQRTNTSTPATSLTVGAIARRGQSFHLRETDTASNRGAINITDNPTLELISRGTSTRNAGETMWQVRIIDGSNAGRIGWTFLLPNELVR